MKFIGILLVIGAMIAFPPLFFIALAFIGLVLIGS